MGGMLHNRSCGMSGMKNLPYATHHQKKSSVTIIRMALLYKPVCRQAGFTNFMNFMNSLQTHITLIHHKKSVVRHPSPITHYPKHNPPSALHNYTVEQLHNFSTGSAPLTASLRSKTRKIIRQAPITHYPLPITHHQNTIVR